MLLLCLFLLAASPDLEAGRADSAAMKYAKAVESLTAASQDAAAPLVERVEAFDLLARAKLALGDAAGAQQAFEALLKLAPMTDNPRGSPKVRAAFAAAKRSVFPGQYLELQRRASGADVLEVEVINPWALEVNIELWVGKDQKPRELPVKGGRVLTSMPPGSFGWMRAITLKGVVLASLGSPTEPILGPPAPELTAPPPAPPPSLEPVAVPEPKNTVPAAALPAAPPQLATRTGWPIQRKLGLGLVVAGGVSLLGAIPFSVIGTNQKQLGEAWPLNGLEMDASAQLVTSGDSLINAGIGMIIGGAVACVAGIVLMAIDWAP